MRALFNRERKNLFILKKIGFVIKWTQQNNFRRPYIAYAFHPKLNLLVDLDQNLSANEINKYVQQIKEVEENLYGKQLTAF